MRIAVWIAVWIVLTVAGLLLLSMSGCKTMSTEEADARVAEAEAAIATVEAEKEAIRADADERLAELQEQLDQLAAQPDTDPDDVERIGAAIDAVESAVAKTVAVLDEAQTRAETALAEFQAQRNEDGTIGPEGQGRAVVSVLPEPFRTWGLLGLSVFGLVRSAVNRNAARSLAKSIERARDAVPAFGSAFDSVKRLLRQEQSATASRIVREAKNEATPMPV